MESTVAKDCKNGATCVIEVIDGVRTPRCDCPPNTGGETCQFLVCNIDEPKLFCLNGACGGADNAICQCDQENGKAKFYGESCDMPVVCNGNPCQNGGKCTSNIQADDTQVCFVISHYDFSLQFHCVDFSNRY